MARTRKLTVEVLGDASSLSKAFRTVGKDSETLGQKFQGLVKKAVVPATAALAGLAFQANKSVQAAASMDEAISKTGVIFGDVTDTILQFSKTTARTFGISQQATLDAASTFAIFGKSAGLAGDDLATFSIDFVKLAGDFASFFNTSPDEAIVAIGAALRGESEPIRRFGVLLNEATLREEAFRLGLIKTTKDALTPQQRVLAARAAIFRQTTDVQGDAARTADSFANRQKQLTAQLADFNVQVGQILLPIFERLLPLLQRFADWASRNPELVTKVAAAVGALSAAIIGLNFALSANPVVLYTLGTLALGAALYTLWQRSEAARNVMKALLVLFVPAQGLIVVLIAAVNNLGNAFRFLWNQMQKPLNALKNFGGGALKGLLAGGLLGPAAGFIGGAIGGLKNLVPFMASGGVVSSPTLAVIGEAGPEAVVPLDRAGEFGMGGGGDTYVTINVNGGDPQAVVNALVRWSRANGSLPSAIRVA